MEIFMGRRSGSRRQAPPSLKLRVQPTSDPWRAGDRTVYWSGSAIGKRVNRPSTWAPAMTQPFCAATLQPAHDLPPTGGGCHGGPRLVLFFFRQGPRQYGAMFPVESSRSTTACWQASHTLSPGEQVDREDYSPGTHLAWISKNGARRFSSGLDGLWKAESLGVIYAGGAPPAIGERLSRLWPALAADRGSFPPARPTPVSLSWPEGLPGIFNSPRLGGPLL